jgi:hypothetical protein
MPAQVGERKDIFLLGGLLDSGVFCRIGLGFDLRLNIVIKGLSIGLVLAVHAHELLGTLAAVIPVGDRWPPIDKCNECNECNEYNEYC